MVKDQELRIESLEFEFRHFIIGCIGTWMDYSSHETSFDSNHNKNSLDTNVLMKNKIKIQYYYKLNWYLQWIFFPFSVFFIFL